MLKKDSRRWKDEERQERETRERGVGAAERPSLYSGVLTLCISGNVLDVVFFSSS